MLASANVCSRDFAAKLKEFGFALDPKHGRGHVTVTHPAFMLGPQDEANYNGEHGSGNTIKRPYKKKFLTIVDNHEAELEKFLS